MIKIYIGDTPVSLPDIPLSLKTHILLANFLKNKFLQQDMEEKYLNCFEGTIDLTEIKISGVSYEGEKLDVTVEGEKYEGHLLTSFFKNIFKKNLKGKTKTWLKVENLLKVENPLKKTR